MHILFYIMLASVPQWELSTSISYVYDTVQGKDNTVWCSSSGGVFNYSNENGITTVYSCPEDLPSPDCRNILFDSSDRLWIATGGRGLVMKDGDGWTTFSTFDGIPGQGVVNALAEAGNNIWVGCDGGVARGGSAGFLPVIAPGIFNPDEVSSLAVRNDTLWLSTDRGIYSLHGIESPFSPDSWTYWSETQGLQLNRVRAGEHSIYACGVSGAMELVPGGDSFEYIIDYSTVSDSAIVDISETSEGLLAAGRGVVFKYDGSVWSRHGSGLPSSFWPTTFFEIGDEVFLAFSFNEYIINLENSQTGYGFYRLQGDSWGHIDIPGIQCKKTHQMASLPDGRLYLGTYARGVQAYYPGYGWRSYEGQDGMPNHFQTFCVAADPSGGIWASSYHHGLSWIRDNGDYESQGDTILTFVKDSLEAHWPTATIIKADIPNNQPVMIVAQNNGLWAAFRQYDQAGSPEESSGILGFNGDPMGTMNWAPRIENEGIASLNVRSILPVSSDSLWIAFETGAGCQLLVHSGNPADPSEDSWYPGFGQAYNSSSGLPSSQVFCFLDAPGIGLLAGTAEGLARWTGSGFVPYLDITEQIKTMSVDSRGRIWCLGTSGIYRIADGQAVVFNEFNSDYYPASLFNWEYSSQDKVSGGVYFSSGEGLWLVTQDEGLAPEGSNVSFYPQPFLSGSDQLRFCGPTDLDPVSVDFFRLDGSHAGTVDALSVSSWTWDGSLDGKIVASGVYMVLVTVGDTVYQARISVVR